MAHVLEYRRSGERRRQPRGGRRSADRDGFAPLVLVVGEKPGMAEGAEAILAKLKFAVATGTGIEEALHVLPVLRPDIVVAAEPDAQRLRVAAPRDLPVVVMNAEMESRPESLVEAVRQTLRDRADA
jgi:hypothetical protein